VSNITIPPAKARRLIDALPEAWHDELKRLRLKALRLPESAE
jgi:hypothetical protein